MSGKKSVAIILAVLMMFLSLPENILASEAVLESGGGETLPDTEEPTDPPGSSDPSYDSELQVQYHSVKEVYEHMKQNTALTAEPIEFDEEPSLTVPYSPGKLSSKTLDSAIQMLNEIRYIAGLDANVTIDEGYTELAQAGALVNAANGELSHQPAQPSGMDETLYQNGFDGCSRSNLGAGYENLNTEIVKGWMNDGDRLNIDRVGHRRWVLNPRMGKTGFGVVLNDYSSYKRFYAMYAFDQSNTAAAQTRVAWPAQVMPIDYFEPEFPWSISMDASVDPEAAEVVLTRRRDRKKWTFSQNSSGDGYFNVNEDGYGQRYCIIFRPDGIGKYENGDIFDVEVSLGNSEFRYSVTFFDYNNPFPITDMHFSEDSLTLQEGDRRSLSLEITPSDTTENVNYQSSDEKVVTIEGGKLKAVGTGTATITASSEKREATCRVTVNHVPGPEATCTEAQICTKCGVVLTRALGHQFGEWTVEQEATYEENGLESRTCERCGETEEQVIPRLKMDETPQTTESAAVKDQVQKGQVYVVNNLDYRITGLAPDGTGTVSLTGSNGKNTLTSLTVKNIVVINGKTFTVTSIADKAFANYTKLKKVVIENNITTIGAQAFAGCKKLTSVTAGTGLTNIGKKAFYKDKSLKKITIKSKKLKKIGKKAIYGIHKKAVIKVPSRKAKAYKKIFKRNTGFGGAMKLKK